MVQCISSSLFLWGSIPLQEYVTVFYLYACCQALGRFVLLRMFAIANKAIMYILIHAFWQNEVLVSLRDYWGWSMNCSVSLCGCVQVHQTIFQSNQFAFSLKMFVGSSCSISSSPIGIIRLFHFRHSNDCVVSHSGSNLPLPNQ